MRDAILLEREFDAAPEQVWRALTDSDLLAQWLMPNTFRLEEGAEFTFTTNPAPGFDGVVRCRVIGFEEHRSLTYSWRGGGVDTVVEWTLEPVGAGTRLRLCHRGFRGLKGSLIRRILGGGWKSMLSGEAFARLVKELK